MVAWAINLTVFTTEVVFPKSGTGGSISDRFDTFCDGSHSVKIELAWSIKIKLFMLNYTPLKMDSNFIVQPLYV